MSRIDDLVKWILVGSSTFSALTGHSQQAQANESTVPPTDVKSGIREFITRFDKPKLILKLNESTNIFATAFHRSHRSHSSHRSHYSSSVETPKKQEEEKTKPATERKENLSQPSKSSSQKLGGRLLKNGLKGPDVTELRMLLQKKGYKLDVKKEEFDDLLEAVVKEFQLKQGIEANGEAGPLTIYYLKK